MKTILITMLLCGSAYAVSYRQIADASGRVSPNVIQRVDDSAIIPANESNRDYAEFLQWQKEGGRILPPEPRKTEDVEREQAVKQAIIDAQNILKTPQERIDAVLTIIGFSPDTKAGIRNATNKP